MSASFDALAQFLNHKMRMSHIYQPIMLIELLQSGGCAATDDIARAFLVRDPTQIQYYSEITNRMPGRVLGKHEITQKDKRVYTLVGYDYLSEDEINCLKEICEQKVEEFLAAKAKDPWFHRRLASRDIPGSLKYRVLSRAKGRCELCGVSKDVRALEVDHIIPRSQGGKNDISNLQALCYVCNSSKRDHDATDFRDMLSAYDTREEGCLFCAPAPDEMVSENELAYSIPVSNPVTKNHLVIVPKRHNTDYFDLFQPELNAINQILQQGKNDIQEDDGSVTGFNVGFDSGESAGQTLSHCCLHVIPRRNGDNSNTNGAGIRNLLAA